MYRILLLPQAQKDLDKFSGKTFDILIGKMTSLEENPRPHGCLKLTVEQGIVSDPVTIESSIESMIKKKKSLFTGLNTEDKLIQSSAEYIAPYDNPCTILCFEGPPFALRSRGRGSSFRQLVRFRSNYLELFNMLQMKEGRFMTPSWMRIGICIILPIKRPGPYCAVLS